MRQVYLVTYRTPSGQLERRVTPFLDHAGQAFAWIRRLKPFIMKDLDSLEIRPHQKGDPK
jgi:hypothetical protein